MNKTKYFLGLFLLAFGALSLPTFAIELNSGNIGSLCPLMEGIDLDCRGQSITSIAPDTFIAYSDIEGLYLSSNELSSIPEGVFNGLSSLTRLELDNNRLSNLPGGLFSGLFLLNSLALGSNQLSNLPEGLFSGLSNLNSIGLNNNQLSNLPEGLFSGLFLLNSLALGSNQLSGLSGGIFNGLSNLLELDISDNLLNNLPEGLFSGLFLLEGLYLSSNQLSNLSTGIFNGLFNVIEIDIDNNQLSSLSEGVFNGLSGLNYLYLNNNQLSVLSSGVFNGLSSLTNLSLNDNQIISIETGTFDNLPSMTYLYIGGNSINGAMLDATTLGYFNIRQPDWQSTQVVYGCANNPLANNYNPNATQDNGTCDDNTILHSGNIGRLCTVGDTTCNLNGLGITSISEDTFVDYGDLTTLYINNNQLSSLSSGVFNGLSSLTELYLYDNQITSVETGSFDNLPSMTYLYIGGNSINGAMLDATTLGYFNTRSPQRRSSQTISGCVDNKLANNYNQRATQDNGTCDDNKGLNSINIGKVCSIWQPACDLSNQGITSIASDTFVNHSGRFEINLGYNQLSSLPEGVFSGLSNLVELNLDNNQIVSISSGLFNGLYNLNRLFINANCLDMGNSTMISYLDSLGASHFDPYVCLGINYTPHTSTTGSVIGSLFFTGGTVDSRSMLSVENPDLGLLSHTWTSNGIYNFDISAINDTNGALWQKRGGMNTFTGKVTWIQDIIAPVFDAVDAEIESDGIIGNLDQVDISNYTAFSGLTFEKRTNAADANTVVGSITFNSALDLSDPETRSFLQDLGSRLSISSDGTISLDFRGIGSGVSLKGVGATIKFYGLDKLGFGADATSADILAKLNVYDDDGILLDKSALLANSGTYVGACGVGETECYVFTIGVNHFTTYKISSNTTNDNNSHGGGGGGSSISKDVCVNGDYSSSYYDGSCGNQPVAVSTGTIPSVVPQPIDPISDELITAYRRAYLKDITTMDTLSGARVQGFLTRGEMAKMIVNYAINILGKKLDTTKQSTFKDLNLESEEIKSYINQVYQLGLMGINIVNFNPQGLVTRGEFATVLARLLYDEEAKGPGFYYDKPIEILRQNGIIKNTNPLMQEVRGYVMLMLMRTAQ